MNNDRQTTTGVSFFGVLACVFIGLKLVKAITWPWIFVLAPLWGPAAFAAAILAVAYLYGRSKG